MAHFPHGAMVAIHAAQEQKRKQDQEEEEMTTYKSEDLEKDWEFKIVRSSSAIFRKPEVFQGLLEEESYAGWELVEKLDNQRVRFKRRRSARRKDATLPPGIDPYRTQYGASASQAGLLITGIILAMVFAVGVAIFAVSGDDFSDALPFFVTIPAMILLVALIFIISRIRGRN